jgi:hypothetical protein
VPPAHKVRKAIPGFRATPVQLVRKVFRAKLVPPVLLVPLVLPVLKVLPVPRVHKVFRVKQA